MSDVLSTAQNEDRDEYRAFLLEQLPPELFADLPEGISRDAAEEIAELAAAQTMQWPDSEEVFWLLVADYFADAEPEEVADYELEEALSALQAGETPAPDEKSALAWLYILDNYPDASSYSVFGRLLAKAATEEEEDQMREIAEHAIECVAVASYPELLGEEPLFLRTGD